MESAAPAHSSLALGIFIAVVLLVLGAAAAFAESVVWSWEQELEPLDILEYVEDLPYDEWVEIDEATCRRLLEDVVQRALVQMELEPGEGGEFERLLRERLLYFTPELEYYWSWPTYSVSANRASTRFPVVVKHVDGELSSGDSTHVVYVRLGRVRDDQRVLKLLFLADSYVGELIAIGLYRDRYIPGLLGEPKEESLLLACQFPARTSVYFYHDWFNQDGTAYAVASDPSLVFQQGNGAAEVDRTQEEPRLEISGVERLFEPGRLEHYYENWEPYDAGYFQAIRGIINLCKLQLDLISNGQALEMVLRRDFLEYTPWDPIDEETFDPESEPANELVSVRRETTEDPENIVIYQFDIGREFDRGVYVRFDRGWGGIDDYEWGVKQISFVQTIIIECIDANGEELRGLGDLTRVFKFELDASGRLVADYYEEYLSPGGWPLTLTEDGFVITPNKPLEPKGYFRAGDPEMHWYEE